MKKLFIIILVFLLSNEMVKAQAFSNWIADANHPNLKVRYKNVKNNSGYNYLVIELLSSSHCKFKVTASLCGNDPKDINKWISVELFKDRPIQRSFKVLNSCTNGFWWWYKDYNNGAVRID